MSLSAKNCSCYAIKPTPSMHKWTIIIYCVLCAVCANSYAAPSTAFFYGKPVPVDMLTHFEQVVLEPDNIDSIEPLTAKDVKVFAYLSVIEIHPSRPWYKDIPSQWLLGKNNAWDSHIADISNPAWQDYLITKLITPLWQRGYRGFFLDTLDSYQLISQDPQFRLTQQRALINFIHTLHQRFPDIKLMLNRGFELFPDVANDVTAVAAESLFQRWNPAAKTYDEVPEADRNWLLTKLNQIQQQYGRQVIVIDYVPPSQKDLARQTADKITALGFTPWISNPAMDMLGIGSLEVFPRRVLALYDGQNQADGLQNSEIHKLLAMPLEYLGYSLDYVDVRKGLPTQCLAGQYAGIVTWFNNDEALPATDYAAWLSKQLDDGLKLAIIGQLGFKADSLFLQRIGIKPVTSTITPPLAIEHSDYLIGYETNPTLKSQGLTLWESIDTSNEQHLRLTDQQQQPLSAVLTGTWGGAALHPYVIDTGFEGQQSWLINPFKFLKKALDLPAMPVPDITTENGKRLLLVQIDGDGTTALAEIPGTPLAMEVIRDQLLKKYPWPTTVSVIEGEVSETGAFPADSAKRQEVLRDILKLDHVEIASHSYSHPATWFAKNNSYSGSDDYQVPIPNYQFNLQREIVGSVDYINQQLAPTSKRVRVFSWTGDGLASPEALALTKSLNLENINGNGATISDSDPSITNIPPLGYPINDSFQIYAPVASDYTYTHQWQGPFFGMKRVIETFKLTDSPLRLKPIHIRYHFYAGSKLASIKALKAVYRWAANQEIKPISISDYARKVKEFQHISVARNQDGKWDIQGLNDIHTLRLNALKGEPNLQQSKGVTGYHTLLQGSYVSLSPINGQAVLAIE